MEKTKQSSSWNKTYMEITKQVSSQSKCSAKHVGCILVKDRNILAIGVNGTFPGSPNCCDNFKKVNGYWHKKTDRGWEVTKDDAHNKWSLIHEVHAEMNALAKANKNGVSVEGSTAYVTHSPCYNCAKNMYAFGIKEIVYDKQYDDISEVKRLLEGLDISLIDINFEKNLLKM